MFTPTGELRLTFRRKQNGTTYLARQYYALPLQVLPPYYQDEDGTAFVYLLNPSGGVLQGDRLLTQIVVERGARVMVTTPAANKFYKMEDDHAVLQNRFEVQEDAVLEYLPDYSIPYAKSRVYQENRFDLKESSMLIASDMITAGRVDRGEVFQYDLYDSKVKIYVEGKLQAYEYAKLEPADEQIFGIGVLQGYRIYASLFIYQKNLPETLGETVRQIIDSNIADNIDSEAGSNIGGGSKEGEDDGSAVWGGISYVTKNLAVVRLLGNSVETMQETVLSVWGATRRHLLGKERVKLRKY